MKGIAWIAIAALIAAPVFSSAYTNEELIQLLTGQTIEQTVNPKSESTINSLLNALSGKSAAKPAATTTASTTAAVTASTTVIADPQEEEKRTALKKLFDLLTSALTEWGKQRLSAATSSIATTQEATVTETEVELPAGCPNIGRVLKRGIRGDDVEALQVFLSGRIDEYSNMPATGYFGPTTEAAVKWWQTSRSIVSSGSAATTGWGVVGEKTRASIVAACSETKESVEEPAQEEEAAEEEPAVQAPAQNVNLAEGEDVTIDGEPWCEVEANPTYITLGSDTTLSWVTRSATSAVLLGVGLPLIGSVQVKPTQTTTYHLTVFGGDTASECTADVEVEEPGQEQEEE